MGTEFNMNVYGDDGCLRTTLAEGKVRVSYAATRQACILEPGEQALLEEGALSVRQVDLRDVVDWKEGRFVFSDLPLEAIVRQFVRQCWKPMLAIAAWMSCQWWTYQHFYHIVMPSRRCCRQVRDGCADCSFWLVGASGVSQEPGDKVHSAFKRFIHIKPKSVIRPQCLNFYSYIIASCRLMSFCRRLFFRSVST